MTELFLVIFVSILGRYSRLVTNIFILFLRLLSLQKDIFGACYVLCDDCVAVVLGAENKVSVPSALINFVCLL